MTELVASHAVQYTSVQTWDGLIVGQRLAAGTVRIPAGGASMVTAGDDKESSEAFSVGISGNVFQKHALDAIRQFRSKLLKMLESGGKQIVKTSDVRKEFGVDATISWQLFKLFNSKDLLGAAQYLPAPVSLRKIVAAARQRGLAEDPIVACEAAFHVLEQLVESHAGDWTRFESMVAALGSGEDAQQLAVQQRKLLFKGHTFFFGVEVATVHAVTVIGPSRKGKDQCDIAYVTELIGLHRLRPNADTFVTAFQSYKPTPGAIQTQPLDAEAMEKHGASVLPQFCSDTLPLLKTTTDRWGKRRTVLTGYGVGLTSVVDLAFGEKVEGVDGYSPQYFMNARRTIIKPTRQLHMELLMHRSVFPKLQSTVRVFGHTSINVPSEELTNPSHEIPGFEELIYETSVDEARLSGVPRRREMIDYLCGQMGWSPEDFDVYRLDVEYPMLDSTIAVTLTPPGTGTAK